MDDFLGALDHQISVIDLIFCTLRKDSADSLEIPTATREINLIIKAHQQTKDTIAMRIEGDDGDRKEHQSRNDCFLNILSSQFRCLCLIFNRLTVGVDELPNQEPDLDCLELALIIEKELTTTIFLCKKIRLKSNIRWCLISYDGRAL